MEASELRLQVRRRNRRKTSRNREIIGLLIISFIVITFSNAYAKYIKRIEVDAPIDGFVAKYNMEVISNDGSEVKLSEKLDLENINPGEFQVIPFIVRNAQKKGDEYSISDVDMIYDIEICHTQNLPLIYDLYQYTGIDENGDPKYTLLTDFRETDTNENKNYYNSGEIQVYKDDVNNKTLELEAKPGEISQHMFKLVIKWNNDGEIKIDNKYVHEVDMVYLVVNGMQEE